MCMLVHVIVNHLDESFTSSVASGQTLTANSTPATNTHSLSTNSTQLLPKQYRCAIATLVCDDRNVLMVTVMILSLLKQKTRGSIVPLLLSQVSDDTRRALDALDPIVRSRYVNSVVSRSSSSSKVLNKPCRRSKLRAWGLIEFDRVILLDADTLVLAPIDILFKLPISDDQVYAVSDIYPRIFNAGLIVFHPSTTMAMSLVDAASFMTSYNEGDQGLLNTFFSLHREKKLGQTSGKFDSFPLDVGLSFVPLDARYNFPTWLAKSLFGKSMFPEFPSGISVLHFAGEVKPWLYAGDKRAFERFYEPRAFLRWWRLADEAASALDCGLLPLSSCGTCLNTTRCRPDTCEIHAKLFASRRFERHDNTITVILSTFDGSRLPILKLVEHYTNSSVVTHVVVVWHNPLANPQLPERAVLNGKRVTSLSQSHDSLNNRFPLFDVDTKSILVCDDDIYVSLDELNFAFDVSRQHPEKLVSPFVRASQLLPTGARNVSNALGYLERDWSFSHKGARRYSIALTKFCFAPTWLLFTYTCLLDPSVYAYVDRVRNCEDVAFNMLAAAAGSGPPLMVDIEVLDFGQLSKDGLSSRQQHLSQRGDCVKELVGLVFGWASAMPKLRQASTASGRFLSTRVRYESLTTHSSSVFQRGQVTRLVLQEDAAVIVPVIEDGSLDSVQRRSNTATSESLLLRGAASHAVHEMGYGSKSSVAWLQAPVAPKRMPRHHATVEGSQENATEKADLSSAERTSKLYGSAMILKVRRRDLDAADKKDERRGTLLMKLVLSPLNGMECPLKFYYLPKVPQQWNVSHMTYETISDLVDVSSSNGFYVPMLNVGELVLFNLKAIDASFKRSGPKPVQHQPENLTIAVFFDSTADSQVHTNKSSECSFTSRHGKVTRSSLTNYL